MPGNVNPQQQIASVTSTAAAVTFTAGNVGAIAIENSGANDCWFTINGLPAAASDGANRTRLKAGESFADSNLECNSIGFICATTTTVQVYSKEVGG